MEMTNPCLKTVEEADLFLLVEIPALHLELIDVKVRNLSRARYYAEPVP